ncbi:glycosyltransferase [Terricaulis silvestris]|uniref:D-inositol 3-phosphate glycosyltransferase n=1 Tax=Terricaulis silvestris TaxID=2686094 RepID=A0A6I6ML65_9CAUL|nr:glycosyltransferase [Terricaulis silvestris]QGZ93397.1 D-inositol 3-phosphate glycosyltransferase [Terricaulis silvestris]
MIKCLHVIAGLAPRYGGPSYSVPRLCQALRSKEADARILSVQERTDSAPASSDDLRFKQDFAKVPILRKLRLSRALFEMLDHEASRVDIIHNHGLWLAPNIYSGWVTKRHSRPLIISPRGMLNQEALAFSSAKKSLFWNLLQGPLFRHAACYHATSDAEFQDLRHFGIGRPVAIIRNGVDVPALAETRNASENRTVLYLGRLHPIKGLDCLLDAWQAAYRPSWRLRIVGVDENGHADELRAQAARLKLSNVSIEGPLYGSERLDAYRQADLFVMPTRKENFGLTIAEALVAGTSVISTKGAPWPGIETHDCGWWIDHGVAPLVEALDIAMAKPRQELQAMGANGRAWMARDYSWDRVAADMLDVYRWLQHGGVPPATVRID